MLDDARRPLTRRTEDIDRAIGVRIRLCRKAANISQAKLGDLLGISYQMVHKYEMGANRIAASTLVLMCEVLGVDLNQFLDGLLDESSN